MCSGRYESAYTEDYYENKNITIRVWYVYAIQPVIALRIQDKGREYLLTFHGQYIKLYFGTEFSF